jgi:hypothetical protein
MGMFTLLLRSDLRLSATGLSTGPQADVTQDAGEEGEEDDTETPDPGKALESINAAQQELAIMRDLITSVESVNTIAVQYVDAPRSHMETVRETALAVEQRRCDLSSAAERLHSATAQLRAECEHDNRFVRELSELQVSVKSFFTAQYTSST